ATQLPRHDRLRHHGPGLTPLVVTTGWMARDLHTRRHRQSRTGWAHRRAVRVRAGAGRRASRVRNRSAVGRDARDGPTARRGGVLRGARAVARSRRPARERLDRSMTRSARLAGAATALVVAVVALSLASGATGAADPAAQLAQRYAPVVRLVEQKKPCGHGEAYVPTDVNLVLGNPDVALRGPWDKINIVKVAPTVADLKAGLFEYHLDFPGHAVAPGCTYDTWSHEINKGHPPTTYARVVKEAKYPDELALQYWFFYVFNDFNDKHEGDWEMIQLDFNTSTTSQALSAKPILVGLSQHGGAESARWGDAKLTIVGGTHPVVYPALGSHANYFGSDLHLGRSAAQGVGCDDTRGPSRELRPVVALIPRAKKAYLQKYPWLGFEGHWGEEHQSFYDGAGGPNLKQQWTQPITWADDHWRDKSFVVPSGITLGGPATGFFCGVIAAGSNVLTALVGDPTPPLIALVVLIALILWLATRTTWHPSTPLRLEHRRTWGSMVSAARRMYFGHLRVFLGIGLIFLPLGVLITVLQYLVFRVSGVNSLVSSAGSTNAVVDFLAIALGVFLAFFGLTVVQCATT